MAVLSSFSKRLGATVREIGRTKGFGAWYGPHMAAAERAIRERMPLVDLVVEVRDARIPFTSAFAPIRYGVNSERHMIVLNKIDLADHSLTKNWTMHLERQNYVCVGVNAHNHDSIKQLLNAVKKRTRDLKVGEENRTATVLLAGIPNVGKSAVANSLHLIGRISAAEKGKLKHAAVSPHPGDTRDITSYKIASHPNIYVLDTPGVLSKWFTSDDLASKLALTGALNDSLIGEYELARYFLAVLNCSEEYKCWENLKMAGNNVLSNNQNEKNVRSQQKKRGKHPSDHTQGFIVRDLRQALVKTISLFDQHLEKEEEMERLIDSEFTASSEAFRISIESEDDRYNAVAAKLLNLYRTGRLGHYTLDQVPIKTLDHYTLGGEEPCLAPGMSQV